MLADALVAAVSLAKQFDSFLLFIMVFPLCYGFIFFLWQINPKYLILKLVNQTRIIGKGIESLEIEGDLATEAAFH